MSRQDVYVAKMEAQLMGWGDELASLESKAAFLAARSSAEFQKVIDAAKTKHQAVCRKFEGLKRSSQDRWETLAAGVEGAWESLST